MYVHVCAYAHMWCECYVFSVSICVCALCECTGLQKYVLENFCIISFA